jgi:hypothetical protein
MNRIVIDDQLGAKLQASQYELELCDKSGRTLGFFLPPELHHELLYAWAKAQVSNEEIERALNEPGGMTTAELMAYFDEIDRTGKLRA